MCGAHTDANSDTHPFEHSDLDADPNPNLDAYAYPYAYADVRCYRYSDPDADTDCYAYTTPRNRFLGRLRVGRYDEVVLLGAMNLLAVSPNKCDLRGADPNFAGMLGSQ